MALPRTALALALALVNSAAAAQSPREIPRWPERAWGQPIPVDGVRPTGEAGVLRSWRAPVDVHVMAGVSAADAEAVLADAEAVMDALELRTGVALPLPDGDRGGTGSFDLYLGAQAGPGPAVVDALSSTGLWDRATAFGSVGVIADPVARRRAVAQAIAEACIYGAKADHPIGLSLIHI